MDYVRVRSTVGACAARQPAAPGVPARRRAARRAQAVPPHPLCDRRLRVPRRPAGRRAAPHHQGPGHGQRRRRLRRAGHPRGDGCGRGVRRDGAHRPRRGPHGHHPGHRADRDAGAAAGRLPRAAPPAPGGQRPADPGAGRPVRRLTNQLTELAELPAPVRIHRQVVALGGLFEVLDTDRRIPVSQNQLASLAGAKLRVTNKVLAEARPSGRCPPAAAASSCTTGRRCAGPPACPSSPPGRRAPGRQGRLIPAGPRRRAPARPAAAGPAGGPGRSR